MQAPRLSCRRRMPALAIEGKRRLPDLPQHQLPSQLSRDSSQHLADSGDGQPPILRSKTRFLLLCGIHMGLPSISVLTAPQVVKT